ALKQEAKINKAIEKISQNLKNDEDQNRLFSLEEKVKTAAGKDLDSIYNEIKKIKRKKLELETKLNQFKERLVNLKQMTHPENFQANDSQRKDVLFSGLKVFLDTSYQLWVGRNAAENDELYRLGSPNDIWIHLRDYPGAHGLLRGPKKGEPTASILDYA